MQRAISPIFVLFVVSFCTAAGQEKKDADPLTVDSQWKGKLTQRGKIKGKKDDVPPEFETVLVVTQRKEGDFECELREKVRDGDVTYLCKGKIAPGEKGAFKVDFTSVSVKSSSKDFLAVPQIPYAGAINGKTLKGTWKTSVKKDDTEVEGEFSLEKQ